MCITPSFHQNLHFDIWKSIDRNYTKNIHQNGAPEMYPHCKNTPQCVDQQDKRRKCNKNCTDFGMPFTGWNYDEVATVANYMDILFKTLSGSIFIYNVLWTLRFFKNRRSIKSSCIGLLSLRNSVFFGCGCFV